MDGIVGNLLKRIAAAHASRGKELSLSKKRRVALTALRYIQIQLQAHGIPDENGIIEVRILHAGDSGSAP